MHSLAGIPGALHRPQQHVHQQIVEVKVLVGHKTEEVQMPIRIRPSRHLEDFRFDYRVRVITEAVRRKIEGTHDRLQRLVQVADRLEIHQVFLDL